MQRHIILNYKAAGKRRHVKGWFTSTKLSGDTWRRSRTHRTRQRSRQRGSRECYVRLRCSSSTCDTTWRSKPVFRWRMDWRLDDWGRCSYRGRPLRRGTLSRRARGSGRTLVVGRAWPAPACRPHTTRWLWVRRWTTTAPAWGRSGPWVHRGWSRFGEAKGTCRPGCREGSSWRLPAGPSYPGIKIIIIKPKNPQFRKTRNWHGRGVAGKCTDFWSFMHNVCLYNKMIW